MIVDYSPTTGLRLLEAEDLKRFKLRLAANVPRPEIEGVSFVDDKNALIASAIAAVAARRADDVGMARGLPGHDRLRRDERAGSIGLPTQFARMSSAFPNE